VDNLLTISLHLLTGDYRRGWRGRRRGEATENR
jgi:hypothetical protein